MPGLAAHLAEQRRLLIAGDAGDRHARRRRATSTTLAVHFARRRAPPAACSRARRTARSSSSSHCQRVDVEQHRARRVADVGDVHARRRSASRSARCRPCRTPARRASACVARAGHVVEDPADLAAGEIRVDEQAGLALDQRRSCPSRLQPLAELGGAPILPDDGVVDRLAGLAVPDDRRLALVGDADGGDVARPQARPRRAPRRRRRSATPRSPAGRARPSPAAERSARNSFWATATDARRRGRRRWRASWWCPGRARGCTACAAQLYNAAMSKRMPSLRARCWPSFSARSS